MPWQTGRARRYYRQGPLPAFDLLDEFLVADPNPLISPRKCEPGPGSLTVLDTDAILSVNFGALTSAGGGAGFDRNYVHSPNSFSRRAGRFIEWEITPITDAAFQGGWNKTSSPLVAGALAQIAFVATPNIQVLDDTTYVAVNMPYTSSSQAFICRVYDLGNAFLYYVQDRAVGTWQPLWRKELTPSGLDAIYPVLQWNTMQSTTQFLRIKSGRVPHAAVQIANPGQDTYYDVGAADGLFEVTFQSSGSGKPGLIFRRTDANNYWGLRADIAGATVELYKVVAGVTTSVGTTSVSFATTPNIRLRAVCFGTRIRTFFGLTAGTATTDAAHQTATQIGTGAVVSYQSLLAYAAGTLPD